MGSFAFVACFVIVFLPKLSIHLITRSDIHIHLIWSVLLTNVISYVTGHTVGSVLATKNLKPKSLNDSTSESNQFGKQDQKSYGVIRELLNLQLKEDVTLSLVGQIVSELCKGEKEFQDLQAKIKQELNARSETIVASRWEMTEGVGGMNCML